MKVLKTIYPPVLIRRNPPKNLKPGDEIYFGGPRYEYKTPLSFLAYIPNAVVSNRGVIIKNFRLLSDFIVCYDDDFSLYKNRYILHVFLRYKRKKIEREDKFMLIFDNYSGPKGFSHWLSDGLTRLVEINDILPEYTALVPEYFQNESIYTETLKLFNVGKIEYIPESCYVKVKNLYVARQIAHSGNFLPENVFKLRQFVWDKLNTPAGKGLGELIYISRAKATRRFVINESEVTSLLEKHGFITVYLEEHSFAKQVEIVYNAKYLISIHGAALTHIHFMQSGSNVLEFRREKDNKNCHFFDLADALAVNYYYQFCKATEIAKAANNFDLLVDCSELDINLERIFDSKIKE